MAVLGAFALLPNIRALGNQANANLHFVGLGHGGTNALAHIHQKGIDAKYSCITGSHVSHLTPDVKHIFWQTPPEYRILGVYYMSPLSLTPEMKAIFSGDDTFVILAGLGSSVGTGLIHNTLKYLQSQQKNYLAICSLPFKTEGRSKEEYANLKRVELECFKNILFFDHNQIITHHPDVPIEEWAKTKYAKLANLTRAESESLSDDAFYADHNGHIVDPGILSIRERFKIGDELYYSIFKQHFPHT